MSDHTSQLIECPIKKQGDIKFWRIKQRDYNMENINKFETCIKSLSFTDIYSTDNPNVAYNAFMDTFKLFYNLCFPFKITTIKSTNKTKWVSRGIKLCSKIKRKLLWQYRLKPNNVNKRNYKNYARKYKNIIRLTQRSQNINKIKTSKNVIKTTWKIINQSKQNPSPNTISKLKKGANEIVTSPQEIANAFSDYFVDKIVPIANRGAKVTKHIDRRNNSMFLAPCIPSDVEAIISSLKNTNSVGYDEISTKVVKFTSQYISSHLSHIINLCISTGIYPDGLKTSVVKPLFKKENKELMESYRPVTLIPVFSKVFEKFIYKQLYSYLEEHNILVKEQKGFRQKKSINRAIYDFLHAIMTKLDIKTPICAIFCDMTQAFDYVDHKILLAKLDHYGIRGNVLSLIESYLTDRKQFVEIKRINEANKREETYTSHMRTVKYGVGQGTVLGPPLFILYINDLPKITTHPMTLFADDSTVAIKCKNKNEYEVDINTTLLNIINWLDNNNLKININKTKLMQFTQRIPKFKDLRIDYNDTEISEVAKTKFLGLTIDDNINWKAHTEELCKKISSTAYALYKLAPVLNIDALLTAYHGATASYLRYGIIFWGNSTNKELVFRAQKRCIRAMFNLKIQDSCEPYFRQYKILTVPCLYIFETATFIKSNPELFETLADTVTRSRRKNTQNILRLQKANTALLRKSIYGMAPKIYNRLPDELRSLNGNPFKKRLHDFLVSKTYYKISDFLEGK